VILLRLPEAVRSVFGHKLLWLWLILIGYIGLVTFSLFGLAVIDTWDGGELLVLAIYVVFAGAIATLNWTEERVFVLAKHLVAGLLVCAALIAIDVTGWIDVPRINDAPEGVSPGYYPYGQFGHRTVMGLYVATMVPFLMVMVEKRNVGPWFRAGALTVGGVYWYMLFWSLNRSGLAAVLVALGFYYLAHLSINHRLLGKRVPDFAVPFALAFIAGILSVPYAFSNYFVLWISSPFIRTVFPGLDTWAFVDKQQGECILDCVSSDLPVRVYESDMVRWRLLQDAFSAMLDKPWGSGLISDSHASLITVIIHASGVVGLAWLSVYAAVFVFIVSRSLKSERFKACCWALFAGLVGWFLVGIMYDSVHLGLAWGFLGIMLSICASVDKGDYRKSFL
jgi:hypothetical protein